MVLPAACRPLISARISFTPCLSSPFKGSSRIKRLGSSIIAWAMPRRCRIPRLYLPTGFFSIGSSPTRRIASAISESPIFLFRAASISRFFSPLYWGKNPGVSMISPRSGGKSTSLPTCWPLTNTVPSVGRRNPQMHFMSTVLPLPLLPTMPWIFPRSKSRVTPWSTRSGPKSLDRFFTEIAHCDNAVHLSFH